MQPTEKKEKTTNRQMHPKRTGSTAVRWVSSKCGRNGFSQHLCQQVQGSAVFPQPSLALHLPALACIFLPAICPACLHFSACLACSVFCVFSVCIACTFSEKSATEKPKSQWQKVSGKLQ
jgi:hypothetical protein